MGKVPIKEAASCIQEVYHLCGERTIAVKNFKKHPTRDNQIAVNALASRINQRVMINRHHMRTVT